MEVLISILFMIKIIIKEGRAMYKSKVHSRLLEYLETVNKNSSDYTIAKVLLEHINEFPDITLEQIASLSYSAPSSVTKFCKKIGYGSFKEMRYDVEGYSTHFIGSELNYNSLHSYIDEFHQMEVNNDQDILSKLNIEMVYELALKIKKAKKICILQASYNHNIVSFLSEILIVHNKIAVSINRSNDQAFLKENIQESDLVILTSLTGDYVHKRKEFLDTIEQPVYILSGEQILDYKCIYPDHYLALFNSYYNSQRYIYIIALLLNFYLNQ